MSSLSHLIDGVHILLDQSQRESIMSSFLNVIYAVSAYFYTLFVHISYKRSHHYQQHSIHVEARDSDVHTVFYIHIDSYDGPSSEIKSTYHFPS